MKQLGSIPSRLIFHIFLFARSRFIYIFTFALFLLGFLTFYIHSPDLYFFRVVLSVQLTHMAHTHRQRGTFVSGCNGASRTWITAEYY